MSTENSQSAALDVRPVRLVRRVRFLLLALFAIMFSAPFAVPGLWYAAKQGLGLDTENSIYLPKPVDNQTWFVVLTFIELGAALCVWVPQRFRLRGPRIAVVSILLFFASLIVSTVLHGPALHGIMNSLLPFSFLIAFVAGNYQIENAKDLRKMVWLLLIAATVVAVYAIVQNAGHELLPYSLTVPGRLEELAPKQRMGSTFGHPNHMADFFLPVIFSGLWILLTTRSRRAQIGVSFAVVLLVTTMLLAGARGALIGLLAGAICFLVLPGARKWRVWAYGATGLFFLVLLLLTGGIPGLHFSFEPATRLMGSKEIAARLYYWMMAVQMLEQHWLAGIGWGNFDLHFWDQVLAFQKQPGNSWSQYVLTDVIRGVRPGFVHNDFLQFFLEGGIACMAGWLAFWAALLSESRCRWKNSTHDEKMLSLMFLTAFISMATDGLFNFPFHIPVSGCVFWLFVGAWCSSAGNSVATAKTQELIELDTNE